MFASSKEELKIVEIQAADGTLFAIRRDLRAVSTANWSSDIYVLHATVEDLKTVFSRTVNTRAQLQLALKLDIQPTTINVEPDEFLDDFQEAMRSDAYRDSWRSPMLRAIKLENYARLKNIDPELYATMLEIASESQRASLNFAWITGDYTFLAVLNGQYGRLPPDLCNLMISKMPLMKYRLRESLVYI